MKKILFGLIATVFFGLSANAQTKKVDLEKMFGPLVNFEIQQEKMVQSQGNGKDQITPVYVEKQKGWVIIVSNSNGIVASYKNSHLKPNSSNQNLANRVSPYRRCEKASSDVGAIICVANVISETIASWFD